MTDPTQVGVAVAQFAPTADEAANLEQIAELTATAVARGAQVVVFPEYSSYFVDPFDDSVAAHAQTLDGAFVAALTELADRHAVTLVAGMVERADGERVRNAVVAVGPEGLSATYRKMHLYDAFGQRESDRLQPGPADAPPLVMDVAGLRFGVLTCYDLRFPESARRAVDAGAEVLVVPAAWAAGELKAMHWRTLAIARAIENTAAVVAVGMAGRGVVGRSLVVGPDGVVGVELDEAPQLRTVDVDAARLHEVRQANPSLTNRRYRVSPA